MTENTKLAEAHQHASTSSPKQCLSFITLQLPDVFTQIK